MGQNPRNHNMLKVFEAMLKSLELPPLNDLLLIASKVDFNEQNRKIFNIDIDGYLPVRLAISTNTLEIMVDEAREPWVIITTEMAEDKKELELADFHTDQIFSGYHLLEKKGSKVIFFHSFDSSRSYLHSWPNVNFPILIRGERTFELYPPLIEGIKKELQTK